MSGCIDEQASRPTDVRRMCIACKKAYYVEPRIISCLHKLCTRCIGLHSITASRHLNLPCFDTAEDQEYRRHWKESIVSATSHDYESDHSSSSDSVETLKDATVVTPPACFQDSCLTKRSTSPDLEWTNYGVISPHRPKKISGRHIMDQGEYETSLNSNPSPGQRRRDKKCDLCTGRLYAVAYCQDCAAFLCAFCSEAHKRQLRTTEHAVLTLQEAQRLRMLEEDVTLPAAVLKQPFNTTQGLCQCRSNANITVFCETCLLPVCHKCSKSHHRSHTCIPTDIATEKQIFVLQQSVSGIKSRKIHFKTCLEDLGKVSSKLNANVANAEAEINKFIEKQMSALESHKKALLQQLNQVRDERQRMIRVQRVQMEQLVEDLDQCDTFVDSILDDRDNASYIETLTLIGVAHQRLRQLSSMNTEFMEHPVDTMVRFDPSQKAGTISGFPMYGVLFYQVVCPSRCFVKGNGLQGARVGHKSEVLLVTRDTDDQPIIRGQDKVQASLVKKGDNLTHIHVSSEDRGDGSYMLTFTPDKTGTFHLHVAVNNQPIKGSPFYVYVQPPQRRKHSGIYHCCTFCSSNGMKDAVCACKGVMPGGYKGCGHGHKGHPGKWHWNCCGSIGKDAECTKADQQKRYEFTL